jgi:hypothetical protein
MFLSPFGPDLSQAVPASIAVPTVAPTPVPVPAPSLLENPPPIVKAPCLVVPASSLPRTTVMLKNISNKLCRNDLVEIFKNKLPKESFNFVYLPIDFRTRCNFGYCFVNLSCHSFVRNFFDKFHCKQIEKFGKIYEVTFARVQGLHANITRLLNSPVMASSYYG